MRDPLSRAYRYRKVAAEFFNLANSAPSEFSCGYYQRIAQRYQLLADGELGWATRSRSSEAFPTIQANRPEAAVAANREK
jgi:hypothetical protein